MNESGDHFFQTGNRGEEAKDTQDAERAQDGERSSSRNESDGDEKATEAGHDPGVGLQAEDDGVENNEKDDAELDGLRLDPCGEFEPER